MGSHTNNKYEKKLKWTNINNNSNNNLKTSLFNTIVCMHNALFTKGNQFDFNESN